MTKCKICGRDIKNPNSTSHINSKIHQNALNQKGTLKETKIDQKIFNIPIMAEKWDQFYDLILFLSLSHLKITNFSSIVQFSTSFGLKNEEIIQSIIKRLHSGDIIIQLLEDSRLKEIYSIILRSPNSSFPLSMKIIEAMNVFRNFDFQNPFELVNFFKSLESDYPGFALLSSSHLGQTEDLITFKRIFPNQILFKHNNRWEK